MSRRVALALLAHPDDCEILCVGTMIRLREEHDYELHIATATPGDCGSATLSQEQISAVRREEAKKAAALIGATYHCLEERDVQVMFDAATVRKAIDLLRQVNPTLVFTHPRFDYMMDHEEVHKLARAATFAFGVPNASARPLPADVHVPHLYYVDPVEALDPYSGEPVKPTTYVDVSDVMQRKTDALACHASQREWLRAHHGMDEYLEAVRRQAAMRGGERGIRFAEAFVQHRGHAYPHDDLLAKLLPST